MVHESGSAILVVPFIITWRTHTSGMSQLVGMLTVCGLLISPNFVITVLAKTFSVVLSVDVDTVFYFPILNSRQSSR